MILVPVKSLKQAKQRLAPILSPAARHQLAGAMLHDVLDTLGAWRDRPDVAVVTCDPLALELASRYDFEVFAESRLHPVVHPILEGMLGFVPPEPSHTMLDVVDVWTDRHPA